MENSEKTQKVQNCESFKELEIVFDEISPVKGSRKEYDSARLKEKICQLRHYVNTIPFDFVHWNLITRSHGIRAKCMELFWYEKFEGEKS